MISTLVNVFLIEALVAMTIIATALPRAPRTPINRYKSLTTVGYNLRLGSANNVELGVELEMKLESMSNPGGCDAN